MGKAILEWLKANIVKVVFYSVVLVGLVMAGLLIRDLLTEKERLNTELIGKTEAYKQLSEHAAKLEIKYKTQEELRAELEKNWANEKDELQGRVKILSNATYLIREQAR